MCCWHPFFSEARAIIEAGELGDILQVTAYAGCRLSSNGSHLLDAVRFLAGGDVQWVFGEIESDEVAAGDDDRMGNGYLAFDNGVRAYVRSMESGAAYWEFDVIGTRGRIRILHNGQEAELVRLESADAGSRGFRASSSRVSVPLAARYPFPMPARTQGTGLTIVEDLAQAIEDGRPPRCSGEDGLAALEAAIAIRESHRRGGVRVTLPLGDRSLRIVSSETVGDEVPRRFREPRSASPRA